MKRIIISFILMLILSVEVGANAINSIPPTGVYQSDNDAYSTYNNPIDKLVYGSNTLGELKIEGNLVDKKTYNWRPAYIFRNVPGDSSQNIQNRLEYDSITGRKEDGNIYLGNNCILGYEGGKKVLGVKLKKPVKSGAILVETSNYNPNTGKWTEKKLVKQKTDLFSKLKKVDITDVSLKDTYFGTHYEVNVVYKVQKIAGKDKILLWNKNKYDDYFEVESYDFYVFDEQTYELLTGGTPVKEKRIK